MIVNPGFGGADGKSAYQYAVEGGYAGSEAEFQALLGSGPWLPVKNYSNPNLLDNWYFPDPVNQRGMTEHTQRGYTVDRWFAYITDNIDDKISITNHGLHFHRADESDGSRFSFNQNLEPWDKYAGMTFTVSFLTTENLYAASFTVPDTKPAGEVYQILKQTELGMIVVGSWNELDALSVGLNKMNASILDFTLVAAKLELGVRQTLAHQDADGNWVLNDPPPNKALEEMKCRRYYFPGPAQGTLTYWSESHLGFMFPTGVTMRDNPSIPHIDVYTKNDILQEGFIITNAEARSGCQRHLKMQFLAEMKCHFSPGSMRVYTALITVPLVGLKPVKS